MIIKKVHEFFCTISIIVLFIGRQQGHISDKRQGYFLNLIGDTGLKIISDMRQGYFWLSTGDRVVFLLATVTCVTDVLLDTGFGNPPSLYMQG